MPHRNIYASPDGSLEIEECITPIDNYEDIPQELLDGETLCLMGDSADQVILEHYLIFRPEESALVEITVRQNEGGPPQADEVDSIYSLCATNEYATLQTNMEEILRHFAIPPSHGIQHISRVSDHAKAALAFCTRLCQKPANIREFESLAVILAALLHDIDDRKYFPKNHDYENARALIRAAYGSVALEARVVYMISLVSASSNGKTIPAEAAEEPWILYPRLADVLDAIGKIGMERCLEYTLEKKRPLYTSETPRPKNMEELAAIATPERFARYKGDSRSMVDHYFDKLLHLHYTTNNDYLDCAFEGRIATMQKMCIKFGNMPTDVPITFDGVSWHLLP